MALILRPYLGALAALALLACDRADRGANASSRQSGAPAAATTVTGPQALVLRVPRAGPPRVHGYPGVDSTVWASSDTAPRPARVLAFDQESGSIAYEDSRGRPVLLELRLGSITIVSRKKLSALTSADGRTIYGLAANGDVVRLTPTGEWTYKPPQPASAVYAIPDGSVLVAVGRGASRRLLKLYPPESRVRDSIAFPVTPHVARTQLGDRLYAAVDSGLVVLRTRTMDWGTPIPIEQPIERMVATPSGDRVFILTDTRRQISVVDRFRERVTARIELPARAEELRVDPYGRYLLARAAEGDSIWIAAIGTQRVIGSFRGAWRDDLPFIGHDGAVAVAAGSDVVLLDAETLKPRRRVRGGASEYWFPFLWDGFRPRAASLDEPVRFDSVPIDSMASDSVAPDSLVLPPPVTQPLPRDSAPAEPRGFIVQFGALLSEESARQMAARIHVGGEQARVVATQRDGRPIYRVVLGPFLTHAEADRIGRESRHSYWVYEGMP